MGGSASKETGTGGSGFPARNVSVPQGFGIAYAHPLAVDKGCQAAFPGKDGQEIRTLHDNFQHGLRHNPKGKCMGYRTKINEAWTDYHWDNYESIWDEIQDFGSALLKLDLYATVVDVGREMNLLGVYTKNRKEWVIAEQACNSYRGVIVPLYDTLGQQTVQFVLAQAELKTIICGSAAELATVLKVAPSCPHLGNAIVLDEIDPLPESGKIKVYRYSEIIKIGRENRHDPLLPMPDDVATFCYTSGTTGDPKGAMLTHKNIVSVMAAAYHAGVHMNHDDIHLSYLPLPHMFERVVQAAIWCGGGAVGFFRGDTKLILDDLKELRPTIFPSVPRLFNRVYEGITGKVEKQSFLKKHMFEYAHKHKQRNLEKGVHSKVDKLVFNKVRESAGLDRCKFMLTGSAPIASHVIEFLRIAFACPVMEGYGQTESAAASTITGLWDQGTTGHVGGPLTSNFVSLAAVEDMGYLPTDRKHNDMDVEGRGEICFKGPNVFAGYFRLPEKTAEAVDSDGWLHSGDIGVWLKDPVTGGVKLKIVDRKKNIFKLTFGEYVAPEKIEQILQKSKFVEQIFVYGDSLHASLVAVVVPDLEGISEYNAANQKSLTREAAVEDKAFQAAVLDNLKTLGKAAKLVSYEIPREITLYAEPFSVENDLLTPTFKLKRNVAEKYFKTQIAKMYEGEAVAGKTGLAAGK